MRVTRRQLLALVGASSLASLGSGLVGCSPPKPAEVVRPAVGSGRVIWLQGAACSGCSVSLLDLLAEQAPATVDELVLDFMVLGFHPTLMGACGAQAVAAAEAARAKGGYLLVVEGAVPTAFGGASCVPWSAQGEPRPFVDVVRDYAERATVTVCAGTCASWGGVAAALGSAPAAPLGGRARLPSPTGVRAATGRPTINVAGCPAHPAWIAWAIIQATAGAPIALDAEGRPTALYQSTVHRKCPRHGTRDAQAFGTEEQCLGDLGCLGPGTTSPCPSSRWNGGGWCIDAGAPCIGCTEPSFPRVGLGSPRSGAAHGRG